MTEIESLKEYYESLVRAAPNIHFSFEFNTLAFKVNPLAADYKNRGMIEEFEKCQWEFIAFMSYEQEIGGEEVSLRPSNF